MGRFSDVWYAIDLSRPLPLPLPPFPVTKAWGTKDVYLNVGVADSSSHTPCPPVGFNSNGILLNLVGHKKNFLNIEEP